MQEVPKEFGRGKFRTKIALAGDYFSLFKSCDSCW